MVQKVELPRNIDRPRSTVPRADACWGQDRAHRRHTPLESKRDSTGQSTDGMLVCGSGKQQQIHIRILDDEILGAPTLLFQRLVKGNTSGLNLKKQQLNLVRCSDGHRYRQQFLPITGRRLDYWSLDTP
jgi:hypothetical protein